MEENEFVSHLCTPRNRPTSTNNNNTTTNNINDFNYGRRRSKRKRTRTSLVRSKSQHDVTSTSQSPPSPNNPELSVDNRAPGLLKIFGDSVVAGAQYKSVLASTRSTAQELIKQALDRYGIATRLYRDYALCESIGKTVSAPANTYRREGDFDRQRDNTSNIKRSKDKKGLLTSSSSSSISFSPSTNTTTTTVAGQSLLLSKDSPLCSNNTNNTHRSARSLHSKKLKKLLNDQSPCGSPRVVNCDSPRTPLGSPRTPCGSPSTFRGSPRTSVICQNVGKHGQDELDLINYRPPKVLESSSYGQQQQHQQQQHQQRLLSNFGGKNGTIDSPRINNNNNIGLRSPGHSQNVQTPRPETSTLVQSTDDNRPAVGDWIQVYFRVLCYSDRPLELQEFWKPPEGFSRRYELKRRRDVTMDAVENETTGLNDNARKIMISKISPGVIPFNEIQEKVPDSSRTTLRDEWNRAAAALTNASLTYTDDNDGILTNAVEGDARQAYVCPSIYPYLLTLRGCSIQKDLVLYPLKSRSLSIGSAEKNIESDDIKLTSHDVSPSHCRITLKRLPQDEKPVDESKKIYWYCLDLEIFGNSFVTVNGIQVRSKATVFPGDLLGIGRQYLFLYKDPTGGHDIPSAVPWLPENETEASAIYSQVIRHHQNESRDYSRSLPLTNHQPRSHEADGLYLDVPYSEEDSNILDDSAARDAAIFLAYHRDKEMELLECIAEVECHSKGDYPMSQALLFLASHQYAARKFSGNHQATFFKRLVRVVRARVGVVSKLVSQQKHESRIFSSSTNPTKTSSMSSSDVDYFPCLVNWLSSVLTVLGHCRTGQFQSYVSSLARRSDVSKSVQEAVGYFEETVSFLFQQVVYSVTKVLYEPINKFIQSAIPDNHQDSKESLGRILEVLQAVRRLVLDLLLDVDVANQLMVYLLFFVSTTLFNRIIAKGSKLYNRDSGSVLQEGIGALEGWSRQAGLEPEFVRVSEHILSLVDLLSSSKRTLMRLDWQSFQTQFSPLTDIQLCKVLGEYDLGDGVTPPESWHPPQSVDPKQGELTVSLSSHPPFVLPKQGELVNLQDTFPAAFYRHLEQVQQRFSLVGEDADYSGLSSAGNTPRLTEPVNRPGNLDTFFSQDPNASISGGSLYTKNGQVDPKSSKHISTKPRDESNSLHSSSNNNNISNSSSYTSTKRIPPQLAPKPKRGQHANHQTSGESAPSSPTTSNSHRAPAPPPYNMAIKLKQAQGNETTSKTSAPSNNTTNNNTPSNSHPHHQHNHSTSRPQPVLHHQNSIDNNTTNTTSNEPKPKNTGFQSNLTKFQTLPDNIKDKLFSAPNSSNNSNNNNNSQSNSKPHRSHHSSKSNRLRSQQSWTPSTQHSSNPHHFNQLMNTSDLASTFPVTKPRPSSAVDVQFSPDNSKMLDNTDSSSGPFMSHGQRAELLSARSNSALGYEMMNNSHHSHNSSSGRNVQQRQFSVPDQASRGGRGDGRDRRENILHPPSHDHVKESNSVTQHVSPYNYNPQPQNNKHDQGNHVTNKEEDPSLFTYGSLKRSPRNTNLSKRTSSENKLNESTLNNKKGLIKSGNFDSDNSDIPPPLPPRGETIRRQPSVESQRDSSRDRANVHRESPLGSALSSSGHRPRSGSRTSVEIQDITENQYIIYNPESPVKEFFDFNQNYRSMVNRNNPENLNNQGQQSSYQQETTRKLTRVPPLELPDDLLGVSENDSQDEVFNYAPNNSQNKLSGHVFGSSDNVQHSNPRDGRGNKPRKIPSVDDYPDDVYIDVNNLSNSDSNASSTLKVLPLGDEGRRTNADGSNGGVFVRYRHSMPETHDVTADQGEITGEVFTVSLTKTGNKLGMGLIDGMHTPLKLPGIYVRNVLPDTPAALCGCLRVGDRILSINGKSIVGVDYNSAMKLIHITGPNLELMVAKCDRTIASKISASTA